MTRKHFKRLQSVEKIRVLMDYDATDVDDIKNIQKYLMEKNNSVNEDIQIC